MAMAHGHDPWAWPRPMAIAYGHGLWPWLLSMVMAHGHDHGPWLWLMAMAMAHGHGSWPWHGLAMAMGVMGYIRGGSEDVPYQSTLTVLLCSLLSKDLVFLGESGYALFTFGHLRCIS